MFCLHLFRGEKNPVKPIEFRPFMGPGPQVFHSSACRPDAGQQVAGPQVGNKKMARNGRSQRICLEESQISHKNKSGFLCIRRYCKIRYFFVIHILSSASPYYINSLFWGFTSTSLPPQVQQFTPSFHSHGALARRKLLPLHEIGWRGRSRRWFPHWVSREK